MVLSQRERYIVLGAALAAAALTLDRLALSPLLEGRDQAEAQKQVLLSDLERARTTLKNSQELTPKWRQMIKGGIKGEPAEAEIQVHRAVLGWAAESGVSLSVLKSDRLVEKTHLPQIAFQAVGSGTMEAVARMLFRMQNASIPLRITELQLATRKEGADDLSVQLRLSTVYMPGGTAPVTQAGTASAPAGAGR